jgi:periplasmic protein TonB
MSQTAIQFFKSDSDDIPFVPLFTLALWLVCLAVGVGGLLIPYIRPTPAAKPPPPVDVKIMQIQLRQNLTPPQTATPAPRAPLPPPPPQDLAPPAPTLTPLLAPSPQIEFPKPVVPAPHVAQPPAPPVQQLTVGQIGIQIDYPPEAAQANEQGTVVVRFTIGENGLVQSAEVVSPCPYEILNHSAVSQIRENRFAPGAVRVIEVPIHFELTQD